MPGNLPAQRQNIHPVYGANPAPNTGTPAETDQSGALDKVAFKGTKEYAMRKALQVRTREDLMKTQMPSWLAKVSAYDLFKTFRFGRQFVRLGDLALILGEGGFGVDTYLTASFNFDTTIGRKKDDEDIPENSSLLRRAFEKAPWFKFEIEGKVNFEAKLTLCRLVILDNLFHSARSSADYFTYTNAADQIALRELVGVKIGYSGGVNVKAEAGFITKTMFEETTGFDVATASDFLMGVGAEVGLSLSAGVDLLYVIGRYADVQPNVDAHQEKFYSLIRNNKSLLKTEIDKFISRVKRGAKELPNPPVGGGATKKLDLLNSFKERLATTPAEWAQNVKEFVQRPMTVLGSTLPSLSFVVREVGELIESGRSHYLKTAELKEELTLIEQSLYTDEAVDQLKDLDATKQRILKEARAAIASQCKMLKERLDKLKDIKVQEDKEPPLSTKMSFLDVTTPVAAVKGKIAAGVLKAVSAKASLEATVRNSYATYQTTLPDRKQSSSQLLVLTQKSVIRYKQCKIEGSVRFLAKKVAEGGADFKAKDWYLSGLSYTTACAFWRYSTDTKGQVADLHEKWDAYFDLRRGSGITYGVTLLKDDLKGLHESLNSSPQTTPESDDILLGMMAKKLRVKVDVIKAFFKSDVLQANFFDNFPSAQFFIEAGIHLPQKGQKLNTYGKIRVKRMSKSILRPEEIFDSMNFKEYVEHIGQPANYLNENNDFVIRLRVLETSAHSMTKKFQIGFKPGTEVDLKIMKLEAGGGIILSDVREAGNRGVFVIAEQGYGKFKEIKTVAVSPSPQATPPSSAQAKASDTSEEQTLDSLPLPVPPPVLFIQ